MWIDCPRAVTEPPTCTHPKQAGSIRFNVHPAEHDVGVGPQPESDEMTCSCDLTSTEWEVLENKAVERYNEGPDEDGMW